MMRLVFAVSSFMLASAWGMDFSVPGSLRITKGQWSECGGEQIVHGASGATVHFDSSRLKEKNGKYYALAVSSSSDTDWRGKRVSLFVRFGDVPAVQPALSVEFRDSEGEMFRYKPVASVQDGAVTRLDYLVLEDGTSVKPWGSRINGRFDGKLQLTVLLGSYIPQVETGTLVYERIVPVSEAKRSTAVDALSFDVDTGDPLHLVRGALDAPALVFKNLSGGSRRWHGRVLFRDHFGRGFSQKVDVSASSGSVVRVGMERSLPAKGIWYVTADLKGDDGLPGVVSARFAAVDRHEVTPILPKPFFRMGINFHAQKYWKDKEHFTKTLDALVASGAKLVRSGGFKFAEVARKPQYDWTMTDAIFNALRSRGFSVNANVYPGPAWARVKRPEGLKSKEYRYVMNFPSRPGFFRDFCAAIAGRYGAGIDYYEMGNEWDLAPREVLSPEEALRLIREGYEGVKSACPSATVSTCGWAGSDSSAFTPARNPGIIETFAETAQNTFDVWAIHLHGSFDSYAKRLQSNFFPLRRRTGLVGKPWYSNETALNTAKGKEPIAARAVWQKILYAWAWGSTDYIWYTLRATGWDPDAAEDSYGLMTPDYRPRATFAAFSALASLVHGAQFDARLVETEGRHIYRLRLPERRGLSLVGWNDRGKMLLRVRTDATGARVVDLMGNETEVPVVDGCVLWKVDLNPSALLLEGANYVEKDFDELVL